MYVYLLESTYTEDYVLVKPKELINVKNDAQYVRLLQFFQKLPKMKLQKTLKF